jgi:hypothetical protein
VVKVTARAGENQPAVELKAPQELTIERHLAVIFHKLLLT